MKCCRYPFWDAVRLGFGGRSLSSCWQGRVPVGRVATVLLREHPSSYDVFSCGMQSFAHVHVPARVFFGASVYCLVLVQRLGWTAFQPFPSNHGTFFFSLSIDRWVGFATPFSSHRTVARRRVSLFLLLPCTSVSTACRRGSLPLLPSGLRDRNGGRVRSLPGPSSQRFSSALPTQKGRNTRFLFPIRGEGRSRYLRGRFGSMDPVRPVGVGLGEEEARPDPLVEQIRTPRHRRSCLDVPRIRDRNKSWKRRERRGHEETRPVEDRHRMEGELIFSSTRPGAGVPKRNSSIDRVRLYPFDRPFLAMVSTDRPLPVEAGRHRLHRIRSLSMGRFVSNRTRKSFLSTPWV